MSKQSLFHFFLSFMILSSFWGTNETFAKADTVEPKVVSLVQLIANPNEYDGKLVRVIGFCRLEYEGDALYLHREDSEHGITKNAVWLDVESLESTNKRDLSNRYVLVEGVFNSQDKGHLALFSGCLREIKRLEQWRSRNELRGIKGRN